MTAESFLQKCRRATWSRLGYLCEAMVMLALSSLAIAFVPFRFIARTATWGGRGAPDPGCRPDGSQFDILRDVRWSIRACAKRVPWRAVCIQTGFAAQWMLRRRGIPSELCFGAASDPAKGFSAHAWVRHGEYTVVGGESAAEFTLLTTFPAEDKAEDKAENKS